MQLATERGHGLPHDRMAQPHEHLMLLEPHESSAIDFFLNHDIGYIDVVGQVGALVFNHLGEDGKHLIADGNGVLYQENKSAFLMALTNHLHIFRTNAPEFFQDDG